MLYLEKIKFCPICGISYQASNFHKNENLFICNNCSYHFYQEPLATVAIIIPNKSGLLLITKRNIEPHKGKFDLPGGFIKLGESPEEAAKRETKEELGIQIEISHIFSSDKAVYLFKELEYLLVTFYFVTKPINELPKSIDNKEIQEVEFLEKQFILDNESSFAFPSDFNALKKYISALQQ